MVLPCHSLVMVLPCHSLLMALPCHSLLMVLPCHSLLMVLPCHSLVMVLPCHSLLMALPCHSLLKVLPCHSLLMVLPCHSLLMVLPYHNLLMVQPCHNLLMVPPYHNLLMVPPCDSLLTLSPSPSDTSHILLMVLPMVQLRCSLPMVLLHCSLHCRIRCSLRCSLRCRIRCSLHCSLRCRIRCSLLMVLLRQKADRCCPASIRFHHNHSQPILQMSGRTWKDTHLGSPRAQCNSCQTSTLRGSSPSRNRFGCHCSPQAKVSHGRKHLHQRQALIHHGELGSLPCFCPGTKLPSNSRWSHTHTHTSPQFHSCNLVHTLRGNRHSRSPVGCNSCRTNNPLNHNQHHS